MRVVMLGTGYVGLVSGACFAEFGMDVVCVDKDASKIARLQKGEIPIYEPGLEELVARNAARKTLSFTTDLKTALQGASAVFVAVGTPSRRGDGHADLSYVMDAVGDIARSASGYLVVVMKSTVPVGTTRKVAALIRQTNPAAQFDVASNPEFLREGSALGDFMRPDRVVIGVESDRARELLRALYRPLFLIETPIVFSGIETAELAKYAANAFLATKITFINEIANLCEQVGADVQDVARAIGLDGRIGKKFLHAGPGYGGSCFPKDTLALIKTARDANSPMTIVESVVAVNEARKKQMAQRVIKACGGSVKGLTLAVLGLTFKPNTDDMRDAASLAIVPMLQEAGAFIRAFDPAGMNEAAKHFKNVTYCTGAGDAMQGADAAVILTEWNEFRALDPARMAAALRRKILIDLRNIYKPAEMREAGLTYISIGRPSAAGSAMAAFLADEAEDDVPASEVA